MRKQILHFTCLLTLSALVVFSGIGFAGAQTTQQTTQPNMATPVNPDITQRELALFDNFMDSHPEMAGQIQKDPSLINNQQFVESHPALQEFLQGHPQVREEIAENPNVFMHREQRYEQREGDQDKRGDRDISRAELANMDSFLDRHPEIAEQLQKDPSLVNNRKFVDNHPALKEFLVGHPEIREELAENPNAFMHREGRFDDHDKDGRNRDNDITRRQLASMDHFLDSHPEIAEQLHKDPSLVDNKNFVAGHPALQEYLQQHPEVRQEIDANPNAFMKQEQRFDRNEDRRWDRDGDTSRGDVASFHQFLDGHSRIAEQLSKNPELAKNEEFMEGHPELQQYLQANPGVQEQLKANPQTFVKSAQEFDASKPTKPVATPKAPVVEPKPKQ